MAEIRQRQKSTKMQDTKNEEAFAHPGGEIKHSGTIQILRLLAAVVYFFSCCFSYVSICQPARLRIPTNIVQHRLYTASWSSAVLDQQRPVLCLYGLDKTIIWNFRYDLDTVVGADGD